MGDVPNTTQPRVKPPKPRAIVAEGEDKVRAATCEILRREGYDVTSCTEGTDVLRLCKALLPAMLFIDVSLPGIDVTQAVRVLKRCRETSAVRVIGICPADLEEWRRSSLKSLGAFAMLQRPLKRKEIVATAAEALQSSAGQRAELEAAVAKRPPRARAVESNNSLLARQVLCPFHEEPVAFDRLSLRSGKVLSETNRFDLPIFTAAVPGSTFVNFNAVATMVCPTCLFATNNPDYFQETLDPNSKPFPFSESAVRAIRNGAGARVREAGTLDADFFTADRSPEAALLAGRLAIGCSRDLLETNPHAFSAELARIGNTHLRNAHFMELLDRPADADAALREAFTALQSAFSTMRGAAIYRVAYQAMALAIHFDDDRTAFQYLRLMNAVDRDPSLASDERAALIRYLPRCQRAWEDRDARRATFAAAA